MKQGWAFHWTIKKPSVGIVWPPIKRALKLRII